MSETSNWIVNPRLAASREARAMAVQLRSEPGDIITQGCKPDGLRPDATSTIMKADVLLIEPACDERIENGRLPGDCSIPIVEDEMIRRGKGVIELLHPGWHDSSVSCGRPRFTSLLLSALIRK